MENDKPISDKKANPPNPTGKGGFVDNPENRNASGMWSSADSISYIY